jgi:hypothetical protein
MGYYSFELDRGTFHPAHVRQTAFDKCSAGESFDCQADREAEASWQYVGDRRHHMAYDHFAFEPEYTVGDYP